MSAVEICCTAADRARLDWLAFALAERGWACGWTVDRMPHADARCAIVVWSNATRDAPWLTGVARGARRRGILVSATLDGVEPPRGLRSTTRVDLSLWPAKTVDRAIDELLDDVASVIANPKPVHERTTEAGDVAVVAVVAALFVGLVYVLVTGEHRGGVGSLDTYTPVEHAVPDPARASRGDPDAVALSADPATSPGSATPPAAAAGALGRRAIDELVRALSGDAEMADNAQTSALAALRVDPLEPNARVAYALCRALLDSEWAQGARLIGEIDESTLSELARDLATRWHLLHGEVPEAAHLVTRGEDVDPSMDVAQVLARLSRARAAADAEIELQPEPPLCSLLDGEDLSKAADAYRVLPPPARLALLSEPCFLTHTATRRTVRIWLGIGA